MRGQHNPTRQRAALYPARRSGSKSLSRFASAKRGIARDSTDRPLPDVEPCPPYRRPTEGRCTRTCAEGDTRPVCFLLERAPPLDRTCLAGPGRYYSCPLDEPDLWETLSYMELNPVRASLVARAECWDWSSAATHCGADSTGAWLAMHLWRDRWSAITWLTFWKQA
jgi:hypothetical protein